MAFMAPFGVYVRIAGRAADEFAGGLGLQRYDDLNLSGRHIELPWGDGDREATVKAFFP